MEPGDRIVYFDFQCTNEMGDLVRNTCLLYTSHAQFASASALRALWAEQGADALAPYVPEKALKLYKKAEIDGTYTAVSYTHLDVYKRQAVFLHDPSREKKGAGKSADLPEPPKFK